MNTISTPWRRPCCAARCRSQCAGLPVEGEGTTARDRPRHDGDDSGHDDQPNRTPCCPVSPVQPQARADHLWAHDPLTHAAVSLLARACPGDPAGCAAHAHAAVARQRQPARRDDCQPSAHRCGSLAVSCRAGRGPGSSRPDHLITALLVVEVTRTAGECSVSISRSQAATGRLSWRRRRTGHSSTGSAVKTSGRLGSPDGRYPDVHPRDRARARAAQPCHRRRRCARSCLRGSAGGTEALTACPPTRHR